MRVNSLLILIIIGIMPTFVLASGEWGYSNKISPDHWAELSKKYGRCKSGKVQSPIDLKKSQAISLKDKIVLDYKVSKANVVNNGHTIEFDLLEKNEIKLNGKTFQLIQFHFHADSEHTINGKHFPAELHLVHKAKDGELAVLGVLIKPGNHNLKQSFFDKVPKIGAKGAKTIDLNEILPVNKSHFFYKGSLTTPPCSEGVNWIVFSEPISIPTNRLKKFKCFYSHNYRETQQINKRKIYYSKNLVKNK